jgi:hypothetical protein
MLLKYHNHRKGTKIMPRTETIVKTYYKFEELDDTRKEKVMTNYYDINVDHGWWELTYMDAETIGLKITGFDIGRGCSIDGDWNKSPLEIAEAILANHGEACETYKLASVFKPAYETMISVLDIKQANETEDAGAYEQTMLEFSEEFERELKQEYLSMLRREFEHLTSEEAIAETLTINDYEFDIDTMRIA